MISTPKVIATIIQSLPNKSDLDIYARDIPNMLPPKITSRETDESYTPDMLVKSKKIVYVFSIDTGEAGSLGDSFFQKIQAFK